MSSDQTKSHKNHLGNQGSSPALLACAIFKVYFIAFSHTRKSPFQNDFFFSLQQSSVMLTEMFCSSTVTAFLQTRRLCLFIRPHTLLLWFGWNVQERVLSSYSIVNFCFFVNNNVRGLLFGFYM